MHLFVKYQVSVKKNTISFCYNSCRKKKLEIKIVCNVFLNKIKVTCIINKGLNLFFHKNYYKLLLLRTIFIFQLTITRTSLFYYNKLYSSCIKPKFFVLLSIARFFLTLHLFIAFFLIIRAENFFFVIVLIKKASNKSIFC